MTLVTKSEEKLTLALADDTDEKDVPCIMTVSTYNRLAQRRWQAAEDVAEAAVAVEVSKAKEKKEAEAAAKARLEDKAIGAPPSQQKRSGKGSADRIVTAATSKSGSKGKTPPPTPIGAMDRNLVQVVATQRLKEERKMSARRQISYQQRHHRRQRWRRILGQPRLARRRS